MINRWSKNTLNNNMGYVAGNLVFSEAEIQRRHQLVRDELKRMDADLMIAQLCYPSASMALDPHITWLLGTPGYKGTVTVILPADGELVMVHGSGQQGTLGTQCPYLVGAGAGMAEYIKGAKKIAYCHLGRISLQFYNFLKETCPGVEIVDFSEQIDLMKAVKSPEELNADMSVMTKLLISSGKNGEVNTFPTINPPSRNYLCFPEYRLTEDDWVHVIYESPGIGGYYSETGRIFYFKEPCDDAKRVWDETVKLLEYQTTLLKPGKTLHEIRRETNDYLKSIGAQEDSTLTDKITIYSQEPAFRRVTARGRLSNESRRGAGFPASHG